MQRHKNNFQSGGRSKITINDKVYNCYNDELLWRSRDRSTDTATSFAITHNQLSNIFSSQNSNYNIEHINSTSKKQVKNSSISQVKNPSKESSDFMWVKLNKYK